MAAEHRLRGMWREVRPGRGRHRSQGPCRLCQGVSILFSMLLEALLLFLSNEWWHWIEICGRFFGCYGKARFQMGQKRK